MRNVKLQMIGRAGLVLVIAAFLCGAAEAQDERFAIRFGLIYLSPTANSTVQGLGNTELSGAGGLEFDFEWYFFKRFGLEGSIATALDADIDETNAGATVGTGLTLTPITAGVNWHFVRNEGLDWYVGVVGGVMRYSNFDFVSNNNNNTVNVNGDSDTTWGAQTAVDIAVSSKWGINVGIKYLVADLQPGGGGGKISVDPVIGRVMGVFRF